MANLQKIAAVIEDTLQDLVCHGDTASKQLHMLKTLVGNHCKGPLSNSTEPSPYTPPVKIKQPKSEKKHIPSNVEVVDLSSDSETFTPVTLKSTKPKNATFQKSESIESITCSHREPEGTTTPLVLKPRQKRTKNPKGKRFTKGKGLTKVAYDEFARVFSIRAVLTYANDHSLPGW